MRHQHSDADARLYLFKVIGKKSVVFLNKIRTEIGELSEVHGGHKSPCQSRSRSLSSATVTGSHEIDRGEGIYVVDLHVLIQQVPGSVLLHLMCLPLAGAMLVNYNI